MLRKMNYSMNLIILVLMVSKILEVSSLIEKKIPYFLHLPPSLQYYSSSQSLIDLKCVIWPPDATISFVTSSKPSFLPTQSNYPLQISPVSSNVGQLISPGHLRLSNTAQIAQLQDQNIHCMSATDYATIISPPFRISRAGIADIKPLTPTNPTQQTYFEGNVGLVDCWLPESHPPPQVNFYFNNQAIQIDDNKYKLVVWPGNKRASLLIHPLETIRDSGKYTCSATNTITKQTKYSPVLVELRVERPAISAPPKIVMPIAGRHVGPQQITVDQSHNLTLFCVMSGAPPPAIQIYNYAHDFSKMPQRYRMNANFGSLTIYNVQLNDSGNYVCSDNYMSSTVLVKVVEPLKLTREPTDVILKSLESGSATATFHCAASKSSATIQWMFNGRPLKTSRPDNSLVISSITASNLGLYQCIAQDRQDWVSASALLALESYQLNKYNPRSANGRDYSLPVTQNIDSEGKYIDRPTVRRIYDNLAVIVQWKLNNHEQLGPVTSYVLQMSSQHRNNATDWWSLPTTVQSNISKPFSYVTAQHNLHPQFQYKFRVLCLFSQGHSITSQWSEPEDASFFNMAPQAPVLLPLSKSSNKPLPCCSLTVQWTYRAVALEWTMDKFRVVFRRIYLNETRPDKKYGQYVTLDVSAIKQNVTLTKLTPGATYQIRVYGIHGDDDTINNDDLNQRRLTTNWSEAQQVTLVMAAITNDNNGNQGRSGAGNGVLISLWNSLKSNKVMYGCLLGFIGLLVFVMLLLIMLCLCRRKHSHKNKHNINNNPFPYGYKEVGSSINGINGGGGSNVAMGMKPLPSSQQPTLQLPGRVMSPGLTGQSPTGQPNHGMISPPHHSNSLGRHDAAYLMPSHYRSNNNQDTASIISDLYQCHGNQQQHPQYHPHGFSTLQPGGSAIGNYGNYRMGVGNHPMTYNTDQQRRALMTPEPMLQHENGGRGGNSLLGNSNRSMSQQHLMMMQQQQQQQQQQQAAAAMATAAYYTQQRQHSMQHSNHSNPQYIMGSQQSLNMHPQFRRSNSQHQQETPIAIGGMPHGYPHESMSPQPQSMDIQSINRAMSPPIQSMSPPGSANNNQQFFYQSPNSHEALYQSSHVRPPSGEYFSKYAMHQPQRHPALEAEYVSHRYFQNNPELAANQQQQMMMLSSSTSRQQSQLNSLPEQPGQSPGQLGDEDEDIDYHGGGSAELLDQEHSVHSNGGGGAGGSGSNKRHSNSNRHGNSRSPGQQHHHRRKTRSRQSNQDNQSSLDRSQEHHPEISAIDNPPLPPMLTPRNNATELQHDPYNNNNFIDNLPRIRDVSEYGIPNTGPPIPPTKQQQNNNNNDNNSSATNTTSSDLSTTNNNNGNPTNPNKYNNKPLPLRPDDINYQPMNYQQSKSANKPLSQQLPTTANMYYQHNYNTDTHC